MDETKTKKPAAKPNAKLRAELKKEVREELALEAKKALEEAANRPPCEHVNLQSYGTDGKPDKLACTKDKGHDGNHGAMHLERGKELYSDTSPKGELSIVTIEAKTIIVDGKPVLIGGKRVYECEILREWGEAAGNPVVENLPDNTGITMLPSAQGEYKPGD